LIKIVFFFGEQNFVEAFGQILVQMNCSFLLITLFKNTMFWQKKQISSICFKMYKSALMNF